MNANPPLSLLPRAFDSLEKPSVSPDSISSTDILRGQKTIAINHNGFTYKLQATRLGKLILTK